jgi:RND family efflux transporter MFP subunit
MKRSTQYAVVIVSFAIVVALGVGVYLGQVKKKAAANEEKVQDESPAVRVKRVSQGNISEELVLTGSIAANAEVTILPEVVAKVVRYHKDKGDRVQKGDVLVELDRSDYAVRVEQSEAALSVAKAQLDEVKTNLANTEKDLERIEALHKDGVVSQQLYDEVKTRHESLVARENVAHAAIEQAQAQLSEAKLKLEDTRIESPISGVVAERHVDIGDMASLATPLYRIVDIETVKLVVDAPERIIPLLRAGKSVAIEVDAYPAEQFEGKISIISPTITLATRTAPVEVVIVNAAGRLRPGMFCRARFTIGEHKDVVVAPLDSLIREGNVYFACVVNGNKAERRRVSLGITYKNEAQILDGLREGDMLVVEGQVNLRTGMSVRIVE